MKTSITTAIIATTLLTLQAQTSVTNSAAPIYSSRSRTTSIGNWNALRSSTNKLTPPLRSSGSGLVSNKTVMKNGSVAASFSTTNRSVVVSTSIAERGPDHRVVWSVRAQTDPDGNVSYRTNSYTELATGMHYQENGEWKETRELIEPIAGGAIARYGPHKVIFAENLNTAGAIDMETPDGKRLRSHVLGLGFYDSSSGKSILFAEVKDCVGQIAGSNVVLYADAFAGVKAGVRYSYTKSGFEQDIVIQSLPPSPKDYGLNPDSTRMQVFTEFLSPPAPAKTAQTLSVAKGETLPDEALNFGEMTITKGRAFAVGSENPDELPVAKQWQKLDGRDILVEEIPYKQVVEQIQTLGLKQQGASLNNTRQGQGANSLVALKDVLPKRKAGGQGSKMQMARLDVGKDAGFVLDYPITLSGGANKTLQGDTTYYCSSAVNFTGTTVIEGGAVIKFASGTTAKITLYGPVVCKTGPYHPAIFTARDDDTVGEVLDVSTGTISGKYGNGLYVIPDGTSLSHLRFSHANRAIWVGSVSSINMTNLQFISCSRPIYCDGDFTTLSVNNSLFVGNSMVFDHGHDMIFKGNHLTIDQTSSFFTTTGSPDCSIYLTNCVLAGLTGWGKSVDNLGGSHNGSYNSVNCGSGQIAETQIPFAPIGYVAGGEAWYFIANAQGPHYLRDDSPFTDAGTPDIPQNMKNELNQGTTEVPALFNYDVNQSQTLGPTAIRDSDAPDLGYHYPVVDYVVCGATVNNCTLNIDQGTILAFTTPYYEPGRTEAVRYWDNSSISLYEWGIRVNPGGRLNVNGVPTNRVVFARLEAVQENPLFVPDQLSLSWCPLITFKGVLTPVNQIPVGPLAEAKIRFADFPTLAGSPAHIANLNPYIDITYDLVQKLELDDCHFYCGWLVYESGGVPGRTFTLRNNIFERTSIDIEDFWTDHGTELEVFEARNNLFYYPGEVDLVPATGANWVFTDNIFDHASLATDWNGPVAVNHHNAYIGMSTRLTPPASTDTDPNVASLSYATGPLGSFYLPATATLLVDKGSRLAADAGLYHFTSFTSNVKEGNEAPNPKTVNIGPHYLALVNGGPVDSDSDGFPDYQEDVNGDGDAQADEPNWQVAPTTPVRILAGVDGANVSGIIQVPIEFDLADGNVTEISLIDESGVILSQLSFRQPFSGPLNIELDSRALPNETMTFKARATVRPFTLGEVYAFLDSAAVSITINNTLSYPNWTTLTCDNGAVFDFRLGNSGVDYEIAVFDSDYPTSYWPQPVGLVVGSSGDGNVQEVFGLAASSSSTPLFAVVSGASGSSPFPPVTLPGIWTQVQLQDVGWWYVAYEDSFRKAYWPDVDPITGEDRLQEYAVEDTLMSYSGQRWFHDGALEGWRGVASWSKVPTIPAPNFVDLPPPFNWPPSQPRTWPIRYEKELAHTPGNVGSRKHQTYSAESLLDWKLWKYRVFEDKIADVRNIYIGSHMTADSIGALRINSSDTEFELRPKERKRFHFVFLDGCDSGMGKLLELFGFLPGEAALAIGEDQFNDVYCGIKPKRPAGAVVFARPRPTVENPAPESFGVYVPYYPTPPPPVGQPAGIIPESVARFYMTFQGEWTIEDEALGTAMVRAKNAVQAYTTRPDVPPWWQAVVVGYYGLRHNQYNWASTTWCP